MKSVIKSMMPVVGMKLVYRFFLNRPYIPARGKVRSGDFLREFPFCGKFGYNRGGPVDRYYIAEFLEKERHNVRGRVLEVGDDEYTRVYGGDSVTRRDVLHVNRDNSKATLTGDLSEGDFVEDNAFDCIVLTQTLQMIYDVRKGVMTCFRKLKPGGVLLVTVPGISPVDQGTWRDTWYWGFTTTAIDRLLGEVFEREMFEVDYYGNVYAATAFLYGMGAPEVSKKMLDRKDPAYPVIICAKARKPQ